ncbi:MAG: histidine kinase [Maricaulaceae bacterium]|jgi:signal transduction histidine kinase
MKNGSWIVAAYVAAGVAGVLPGVMAIMDGSLVGGSAAIWAISACLFALLFAISLRADQDGGVDRGSIVRMILMTAAAFAMLTSAVDFSRHASTMALVLIAQRLPSVVPKRAATLWIVAQSIGLLVVYWSSLGPPISLTVCGVLLGVQFFAVSRSELVLQERRAREALEQANAELRATRELLAERSREAERLRISRDLHDTLGHHLAALSIQLDIASRQIEGPAADHVREAHAIARLLLSDVRDVVSRLRDGAPVDVIERLAPLAVRSGPPKVHLKAPATLKLSDAERADALIRCVQEIITNAARHAGAQNVWIEIAEKNGGIALTARDDGRGAAELAPGHGLAGMKERFSAVAGEIDFATSPGEGFSVTGFVPFAEAET